MSIYDDLKKLRLHHLNANLDSFVQERVSKADGPYETILAMVASELKEKQDRTINNRLVKGKIGKIKPMTEFDWDWPTKIDRSKIEEHLSCEFIKEKRNLLLMGAEGVGKTMIAKNIAWNAALTGINVLFTTASDMAIDLGSQESTAALQRQLKKYCSPRLLVIDELGYLSFERQAADLIFNVINKRYEKGSIVLTTNQAFRDWGKVFPGAACVSAMVDRLTHHTAIVPIEATSFRGKRNGENIGKQ